MKKLSFWGLGLLALCAILPISAGASVIEDKIINITSTTGNANLSAAQTSSVKAVVYDRGGKVYFKQVNLVEEEVASGSDASLGFIGETAYVAVNDGGSVKIYSRSGAKNWVSVNSLTGNNGVLSANGTKYGVVYTAPASASSDRTSVYLNFDSTTSELLVGTSTDGITDDYTKATINVASDGNYHVVALNKENVSTVDSEYLVYKTSAKEQKVNASTEFDKAIDFNDNAVVVDSGNLPSILFTSSNNSFLLTLDGGVFDLEDYYIGALGTAKPVITSNGTDFVGSYTDSSLNGNMKVNSSVSGLFTGATQYSTGLTSEVVGLKGASYYYFFYIQDGKVYVRTNEMELAGPVNSAPVISAGSDQTITLPNTASLVGTASDDSLPEGATLVKTWSKTSGSGTVTFGDASALATTATFSEAGAYVLTLTVGDGEATSTDDVSITVNPAPSSSSSGSSSSSHGSSGGYVQTIVPLTPVGQVLGASTYSFRTNLQLGSTGTGVKALQEYLKANGFFKGPVTGYFGPLTQNALKAYQKAKGLPMTGRLDNATRLMLNSKFTTYQQYLDLVNKIKLLQAELKKLTQV